MIIQCINCNKNFEVDYDLIPSKGRVIQCGSCDHVWFFKKNDEAKRIISDYHKGKISVKKSVIGKGSTFEILLKKNH